MFTILHSLQSLFMAIFASDETATRDSVAYHAQARTGETQFSRAQVLRRYY
ncbi:MAG: hypothetical protein ABI561_08210 [Bradyrhizobium sp.]